ncbi:MAG TPA: hypothetical protein DCP02_03405 [Actinobacteria bacterium]|nr:hypothetical protein [Actinomycetota bacterium]
MLLSRAGKVLVFISLQASIAVWAQILVSFLAPGYSNSILKFQGMMGRFFPFFGDKNEKN